MQPKFFQFEEKHISDFYYRFIYYLCFLNGHKPNEFYWDINCSNFVQNFMRISCTFGGWWREFENIYGLVLDMFSKSEYLPKNKWSVMCLILIHDGFLRIDKYNQNENRNRKWVFNLKYSYARWMSKIISGNYLNIFQKTVD